MIKWFKPKQNGVEDEQNSKCPTDENDLGILVINRHEAKLISRFIRSTLLNDFNMRRLEDLLRAVENARNDLNIRQLDDLLRAVENAHNDDFDPINRRPW